MKKTATILHHFSELRLRRPLRPGLSVMGSSIFFFFFFFLLTESPIVSLAGVFEANFESEGRSPFASIATIVAIFFVRAVGEDV